MPNPSAPCGQATPETAYEYVPNCRRFRPWCNGFRPKGQWTKFANTDLTVLMKMYIPEFRVIGKASKLQHLYDGVSGQGSQPSRKQPF
jgi:hypothetical protein